MRKDVVYVGAFVLAWFLVLYVAEMFWFAEHLVSFWSILALSIVLLVAGLVIPERKVSKDLNH